MLKSSNLLETQYIIVTSRPEVFVGVLENFENFTRKDLCSSLFSEKLQGGPDVSLY